MLRSSPPRLLALLSAASLLASLTMATVAAPASAAKPKCQGRTANIVGTARSDVIRGTARQDIIVAKGGNDRIYGKGGNDLICAGAGNDTVYGGPGADTVWGQVGHDRLFGNSGPDFLAGQVGNDTVNGGIGVDTCYQGTGTGAVTNCERPAAPAPPPPPPAPPGPPTPGTLVIGGPGSGQVAHSFRSVDSGATWDPSAGCDTVSYNNELRRLAMEFPLSGLPAGASLTKATLSIYHSYFTQYTHSIRGYAGNGTVEVADILPFTTAVLFTPSPSGTRTTVDVTTLVTPSVVSSGWAGLQMRKDVNDSFGEVWHCRVSDPEYPTLTIDYLVP